MAARFWVIGGVDTNWSTIGNWSLTSGGAGGQAVPTNADDVTFDGAGNGACVLNTATAKVAKTLTVASGYTSTLTFNVNLSVSGSITLANAAYTMAGAGLLRMIAAGTWTTNGKTISPIGVEIGGTTTFTCTLADALTIANTLALTNTTSTIFSGAFPIAVNGAGGATISGSQTVTLSGTITVSGTLVISDANLLAGSFTISAAGLTMTGTLGVSANSPTITLTGGTWSGTASCTVPITFAGNVTVSGTVTGTNITRASGTITTTSSTLSIAAATSLDTAGMSWANITLTAALTLTINSLLTVTGTLTLPNAAVTFAGTAGWTVGTFTNTTITATRIWTWAAGKTYTVLTAMDTQHAAAQTVRFSWVSSSPGTKVIFTLGPGATQDNGFLDPTDFNSSLGQIVFTYHGVVTTCFNWATAFLVNAGITRPSYQLGV